MLNKTSPLISSSPGDPACLVLGLVGWSDYLLFGTAIAINPTKDAAIFIGMNQIGADPAEKAVEIVRRLP